MYSDRCIHTCLTIKAKRTSFSCTWKHWTFYKTHLYTYLPYHKDQTDQLQLYMETLDILQDTLDVYSESTPLMIMGDFKASLPQHNLISNQWYKCRPFNRNSLFLCDFICNNNLEVCFFSFTQKVNHTYMKDGIRSYIDHVFITESNRENI